MSKLELPPLRMPTHSAPTPPPTRHVTTPMPPGRPMPMRSLCAPGAAEKRKAGQKRPAGPQKTPYDNNRVERLKANAAVLASRKKVKVQRKFPPTKGTVLEP